MASRIRLLSRPVSRAWFSSTPAKVSEGAALKHRPLMPMDGTYPLIANDSWVAPSATVVRPLRPFAVACMILQAARLSNG